MAERSASSAYATTAPLVLAIDLGTSGCKCALVGFDGAVASWAFAPVKLHLDAGGAEQDPHDWWSAFLAAAHELCGDRDRARRVVAVCASAQGEGTVPVDRNGEPLGRALIWLDMRGGPAIRRRARGRFVNVAGYAPVKLWRWLRLTGGAPAELGKDNAGHIAFLADHDPRRYAETYKFLNVLDYLNLRLSGRFVATADLAMTLWATDNRDPSRVHYDNRLLKIIGVEREKLPDIVASTAILGPLKLDIADALGLSRDVAVVAGAIDTSAVAVRAAVADRAAHLYLGTSSWLGAHVPKMKTDVIHKIAAVPCAMPNRYLATALQSAAGVNLSFLRDRILFHPDELYQDEERPDLYEALNRIAQRAPAGANGLIYMPWLYGERTPVDDPHLRAGLVNLSLAHSRVDLIRAFMEGVALNTRWMLEPFAQFVGDASGPIVAVGGGAQSAIWRQILADVCGRPIVEVENPIQSNAVGAAFIAAVAMGAKSFADLAAEQRGLRVHEPSPINRALYDDRFGVFKELHGKLAPIYRRLNPSAESLANARL